MYLLFTRRSLPLYSVQFIIFVVLRHLFFIVSSHQVLLHYVLTFIHFIFHFFQDCIFRFSDVSYTCALFYFSFLGQLHSNRTTIINFLFHLVSFIIHLLHDFVFPLFIKSQPPFLSHFSHLYFLCSRQLSPSSSILLFTFTFYINWLLILYRNIYCITFPSASVCPAPLQPFTFHSYIPIPFPPSTILY